MADQNLNVNLTVDSTQFVQGVSHAASGVEKVGNSADNASGSLSNMEHTAVSGAINITRAEKNIAVAINQIQQRAAQQNSFFQKLGDTAFRFNEISKIIQSSIKQINDFCGNLQKIGEASATLGTSAEYFQKLEKTAKDSGASIDDVSQVFKNIQANAKMALAGDNGAIQNFRRLGVSIEDIREADVDTLKQVPEITERAANDIYNYFHKE